MLFLYSSSYYFSWISSYCFFSSSIAFLLSSSRSDAFIASSKSSSYLSFSERQSLLFFSLPIVTLRCPWLPERSNLFLTIVSSFYEPLPQKNKLLQNPGESSFSPSFYISTFLNESISVVLASYSIEGILFLQINSNSACMNSVVTSSLLQSLNYFKKVLFPEL
jgi:hypothetical protein